MRRMLTIGLGGLALVAAAVWLWPGAAREGSAGPRGAAVLPASSASASSSSLAAPSRRDGSDRAGSPGAAPGSTSLGTPGPAATSRRGPSAVPKEEVDAALAKQR